VRKVSKISHPSSNVMPMHVAFFDIDRQMFVKVSVRAPDMPLNHFTDNSTKRRARLLKRFCIYYTTKPSLLYQSKKEKKLLKRWVEPMRFPKIE